MRRDFKGKRCAYCSKAMATSEDHVFARQFFLEKDRKDLPKAPACHDCNGKKSRLEMYLAAVLPFGGRHAQATENLTKGVPKAIGQEPEGIAGAIRLHENDHAN